MSATSQNPLLNDRWAAVLSGTLTGPLKSQGGTIVASTSVLPLNDRSVIANGGARVLAPRNGCYSTTSVSGFQPTASFTFAFWVNIDRVIGSTGGELAGMWDNGSSNIWLFRWSALTNSTSNGWNGSVTFFLSHDNGTVASVNIPHFGAGSWHLLVGRWDSVTHTMAFSVDGSASSTATGITTPDTGTGPLVLMARGTGGSPASPTSGAVDSAMYWAGTALNDTQIATLWNGAVGWTGTSILGSGLPTPSNAWDFANASGTATIGSVNLTANGSPAACIGASGVLLYSGNTSDSQPYEIQVPLGVSPPVPLVIYTHGAGENQSSYRTDLAKAGTLAALLSNGYAVASSEMHDRNWGNQAALNDLANLYNEVTTLIPVSHCVFWAQSMGGLAALLSTRVQTIPNVTGWCGICPVTNLDWVNSNGFGTEIAAAYNYDGTGVNTYANSTVGHDPTLYTETYDWPPIRYLFFASPDDTIVNTAANTTLFSGTILAGIVPLPLSNTVITTSGDHTTDSDYQPDVVVGFFNGC